MKYQIDAVLTLTAPLHVSCPRAAYANPDKLSVTSTDNGVGRAIGTQKIEVLKTMGDRQAGEGTPTERNSFETPIITANGIRGRLRRLAARRVFDGLKERNDPISLDSYHAMTCGAVTSRPEGSLTLDESIAAVRHPFLGLFGGGPKLVRSALQLSTAYAVTKNTIAAQLVPDDLLHVVASKPEYQLCRAVFFRRIDDALAFTDPMAKEVVADYEDSLAQWMGLVGANNKARADERKRKSAKPESVAKLALKAFNCVEVVIPGVRFYFNLRLDTRSIGEPGLGLFLNSLLDFCNDQSIGGMVRLGFGRFSTEATIRQDGHCLGNLFTKDGGSLALNARIPDVASAMEAWADKAKSLTAEELEGFFKLKV